MNKKLTTEKFITKAIIKHGDLYDYSKVKYIKATQKITIICSKCKNEWETLPHNHLAGRGCKICQYKNLKQNQPDSIEHFLEKSKQIYGNKFTYLSGYKTTKSKIKLKCTECDHIFKRRASSHLENYGCPSCQTKKNIQNKPQEIIVFEERCKKVHNKKYEYCGDYKGQKFKIKIFCKKHQSHFTQNAGAHLLKKQGCPKCKLSKGELKIEQTLKMNSIQFEKDKKFNDCKNKQLLRFDFFLPTQNTCIEYDGEQHFYAIKHFGGEKRFLECKKNDEIKNEFCKINKINLIRIPFFEFNNIEKFIASI